MHSKCWFGSAINCIAKVKLRTYNTGMKVVVHQGSVLFIMVIDVPIEDVRDGSLMELFYADDLVLCE